MALLVLITRFALSKRPTSSLVRAPFHTLFSSGSSLITCLQFLRYSIFSFPEISQSHFDGYDRIAVP